jgi:uncharacterized protein YcnI
MKTYLMAAAMLAAASAHAHVTLEPEGLAWRGGPLPDDYYEEFVLFGKLPAAGKHVFRIVLSCQAGGAEWDAVLETR